MEYTISATCTKANRTLGFLRQNLYQCPQDVKEAGYRGLICPILEYGSCVWDPQGVVLQHEIEKVQTRAARFVTSNYCFETGSMTGILEKLKWEPLKKRRRDSRLILLYKGLKGAASIPTDDLTPVSPQLGAVEIITHFLLFRPSLQELTFTWAHSSLKQSEIGMPFQIWLLPLLKVQRMVWLGLPLWWELGTNFPYHRSWWMNVIRRITSKNSDSDCAEYYTANRRNTYKIFWDFYDKVTYHHVSLRGQRAYNHANLT